MTSTNIDYTSTYFEHPKLSKICGQPDYEGLKTLKNEIKANLASVTSDLGGGAHGHLGLGLTITKYARIVPYIPLIVMFTLGR